MDKEYLIPNGKNIFISAWGTDPLNNGYFKLFTWVDVD
jgi:hypothetical protein